MVPIILDFLINAIDRFCFLVYLPSMKTHWISWMAIMAGLADKRLRQQIEYLTEENRVLREHIHTACGKKRIRLTDSQRRRLAVKAKAIGAKVLGEITDIFSPETILGWYRKLVAKKYDGAPNRKGGRTKISKEIVDLVVRIAKDNKSWGHRRIRNYVVYLGYMVSNSSVQRILEDYGIDPNGRPHKPKPTWNEFIRSHMDVIAATDFFSVEVLTPRGLVRYMVLFVIDLATRKVEIAGIRDNPDGEWMKQIARNLTAWDSGFLKGKRYLVHDRDTLFTKAFKEILADGGVECVSTQPNAPTMNCYSEVWVRTVKHEMIKKMIFTSEAQLRYALEQFMVYYHHYRPHQGLDGAMIDPLPQDPNGRIERVDLLGGLLRGYRRVGPEPAKRAA